MPDRILLRRDTQANWTASNPVLANGEPAVITDSNPRVMKVGDGVTAFADLPELAVADLLGSPFAVTPPDVASPYGTVVDGPGVNLVTNPSFEVDTAGWVTYASGAATVTLSRVATDGVVGSSCIEISTSETTGQESGARSDAAPVAAGDPVSVSAWLKGTTVPASQNFAVYAVFFDSTGASLGHNNIIANVPAWTGEWRRLTASGVAPAGATTMRVHLTETGSGSGAMTWRADGVQLEQASKASSYLDGSLGPGYSWDGAAHASVSRRAGGLHVLDSSGELWTPDRIRSRGARIYTTAAQSIPSAVWTALNWHAEAHDTDGFADLATFPTRLTVPETRRYRVTCSLLWDNVTGTSARQLGIYRNGTTVADDRRTSATASPMSNAAHYVADLNAGDYIEAFAWQNTGAALNTTYAVQGSTYLAIEEA